MQKRILVVTHDLNLLASRSGLLLKAGYAVTTACRGDTAIEILEKETIDLVLIGRNSVGVRKQIDQLLREIYPSLLILKITELSEQEGSFASHMTNAEPKNVLAALKGMLAG